MTQKENADRIKDASLQIKAIIGAEGKIDTYPNIVAEAVTDEAELQTISERTTADGASIKDTCAYVKSIHGNCVKWNQLATNLPRTQTRYGVTFTNNGDGTITVNGTATADTFVNTSVSVVINHKYIIVCCPLGGSSSTYRAYTTNKLNIQDFGNGAIGTSADNGTTFYVIAYIKEGYTANNLVFRPMMFDLTAMGWEDITSADEFAQRLGYDNASSLPYFAYDEGSIKTFNATKIVSKDSDGETIGELSTDIPSLFADGLCSAGTAYDEVTKNKAVKRIGKVDLGTLTWAKYSVTQGTLFRADISDIKQLSSSGLIANIYCAKYETTSATTRAEGTISVIENRSSVDIIDSSYTDATAFKNSLNGVYLYYELATPVEQTLTERKSWYKVSANGKEQIVGTNSAPMKAEIGYRYISEVAPIRW